MWWLVLLIQLAVLPAIVLIQRLCILLTVLRLFHITSILTIYLNTSLWIWTIYLITASAQCGTGLENPLFTSLLILVFSLLASSLLDCLLSREGTVYLLLLLVLTDSSAQAGTCWTSSRCQMLPCILVSMCPNLPHILS